MTDYSLHLSDTVAHECMLLFDRRIMRDEISQVNVEQLHELKNNNNLERRNKNRTQQINKNSNVKLLYERRGYRINIITDIYVYKYISKYAK
jgi:hypothetical protein